MEFNVRITTWRGFFSSLDKGMEGSILNEKKLIEKLIGEYMIDIQHIGSTVVPRLKAKPIIDIAIVLERFEDGLKCIAPLEKLGYKYRENVLPERYYFNKGEPRTHQIHMYEKGNKYLMEQLKFRDHLISNNAARIQYEQLKIQLSQANPNNKHQYAEEKTDFIRSILNIING